jgi:Nucleotidyl transferase AbiEii toxin, Type IV TA system
MKKLLPDTIERISDFEAESPLAVRGYALEKDYFVLAAIRLINALPADPDFRFVFCGGTCLAKAYGILERMSEDVDFKIVLNTTSSRLGRAALRRKLSALVKKVMAAIEDGGFGANSVVRRSLDDNRYTALDITYESAFTKPASLRSHLLIELNYVPVCDPPETRKVGLLLDKLISGAYQSSVLIECVSLREALAEKLVSFPRRLALQLQKSSATASLDDVAGWDKSLVRHLYDVYQIVGGSSVIAANAPELARMVSNTIVQDAVEFAPQHPKFCAAPLRQMQDALVWAAGSKALQRQYDGFVADMVYGAPAQTPSFRQALDTFSNTLQAALASIHPATIIQAIESALILKQQEPA